MAGRCGVHAPLPEPESREHDRPACQPGRHLPLPLRRLRQSPGPVAGRKQLSGKPPELGLRPQRQPSPRPSRRTEHNLGVFYYQSAVRMADITDGLSNTAFFSEKIRGTDVERLRRPIRLAGHVRHDQRWSRPGSTRLIATCQALSPRTTTRLTRRQGMSWVMGEMCCTAYNHVSTPNGQDLRGPGIRRATMANMPMQVPPSSRHPGGVERDDGRRLGQIHQELGLDGNLASPRHSRRRRSHQQPTHTERISTEEESTECDLRDLILDRPGRDRSARAAAEAPAPLPSTAARPQGAPDLARNLEGRQAAPRP